MRKQYRNVFNRIGLVVLLAVLAVSVRAGAQAISGDVVGTVFDKSGAVVPNALIEAVSTERARGTRRRRMTTGNIDLQICLWVAIKSQRRRQISRRRHLTISTSS